MFVYIYIDPSNRSPICITEIRYFSDTSDCHVGEKHHFHPFPQILFDPLGTTNCNPLARSRSTSYTAKNASKEHEKPKKNVEE